MELAYLALDGQRTLTFFNATNNLSIDIEALADFDDFLCVFWLDVHFKSVSHIKHLIHFAPVCPALFGNSLEKRRNREHIVFYHLAVFANKMKHLRLCAPCAVHHSVDVGTHFVQDAFNNRSVSTCGRQNQFASIDRGSCNLIC